MSLRLVVEEEVEQEQEAEPMPWPLYAALVFGFVVCAFAVVGIRCLTTH